VACHLSPHATLPAAHILSRRGEGESFLFGTRNHQKGRGKSGKNEGKSGKKEEREIIIHFFLVSQEKSDHIPFKIFFFNSKLFTFNFL
jgi:hypothetical protein